MTCCDPTVSRCDPTTGFPIDGVIDTVAETTAYYNADGSPYVGDPNLLVECISGTKVDALNAQSPLTATDCTPAGAFQTITDHEGTTLTAAPCSNNPLTLDQTLVIGADHVTANTIGTSATASTDTTLTGVTTHHQNAVFASSNATADGVNRSLVIGSNNSAVSGTNSSVIAAATATITGTGARSGVLGGSNATITSVESAALAGNGTQIDAARAGVLAGQNNTVTVAGTDGAVLGGRSNTVSGPDGVAIGFTNTASGAQSFAGGSLSVASGIMGFAFGAEGTTATNEQTTAFGRRNTASGIRSFVAGGIDNQALNDDDFAGGAQSTASGSQSFSFGFQCQATGDDSVAMGAQSQALDSESFAICGGIATGGAQGTFAHGNGNGVTPGFLVGTRVGFRGQPPAAGRAVDGTIATIQTALIEQGLMAP